MGIEAPDRKAIQKSAARFGISLADSDADTYAAMLEGVVEAYRRLDAMEDIAPPIKFPRSVGRAPRPEENPYNAWVWLGPIEGAKTGLLAGKRVGVKDNVCIAGFPMRNGSPIFEGFVPDIDASVVTRVLEAGGTIVG